MSFVAAKCTQCGGNIEVDNTKGTGSCTSCGTVFVNEKSGFDVGELLKKAETEIESVIKSLSNFF